MSTISTKLKVVEAGSNLTAWEDYVKCIDQALKQDTYKWRDTARAFSEAADQYGKNSNEFTNICLAFEASKCLASKIITIANSARLAKYEIQFSKVTHLLLLYRIANLSDEHFDRLKNILGLDKVEFPVLVSDREVKLATSDIWDNFIDLSVFAVSSPSPS